MHEEVLLQAVGDRAGAVPPNNGWIGFRSDFSFFPVFHEVSTLSKNIFLC